MYERVQEFLRRVLREKGTGILEVLSSKTGEGCHSCRNGSRAVYGMKVTTSLIELQAVYERDSARKKCCNRLAI